MSKTKIRDGINLETSSTAGAVSGDLRNDAGALKFYDGSGEVTIATTADIADHADDTTSVHGVSGDIVGTSDTQTLTNKTIDADNNTVSNIANDEIKAGAAIDATKIADGSVSSTEFQYLANVTSDIQTQLDGKQAAPSGLTDNTVIRANGTDAFQGSGVTIDDSDNVVGVNDLTTNGSVVIGGDLTVNGTTTTINTATLDVEDANITINKGGNQVSAAGAGITVEMSDATDAAIVYDSTLTSKFKAGAVGSEDEIVTKSATQVITGKDIDGGTMSNTNRITLPKGTTAGLDALTDKEATIAYDTDLGTIVINDGTGWTEVSGAGGAGDVNWSINPFFADDLTGVTTTDAVNLAITRTTTVGEVQLPHISEGSLKIAKAASDESTEYVQITDNASIAPYLSDQNLAVVKVKVDTTVDANYVHESFEIDVVNGSGTSLVVGGTVAIEANTNKEYQVLINPKGQTDIDTRLVCTSTNTTAYSFIVGSHFLGELGQAQASEDQDWQSYTPEFTGFGTVSAVDIRYAITSNGVLFVKGRFTTGTPAATEGRMSLPSGKTVKTGSGRNIAGLVIRDGDTTIKTLIGVGGNTYFTFGNSTSLEGDNNANFAGNNEIIYVEGSIEIDEAPIKNTLTNYELGLQTARVLGKNNSGGLLTANVTNITFNEVEDKFGLWDGTTYTASRDEFLLISGSTLFTTSVAGQIMLYLDGVVNIPLSDSIISDRKKMSGLVKLSAGQTVNFRHSGAGTIGNFDSLHYLSLTSLPDFTMYNAITSEQQTKDHLNAAGDAPIYACRAWVKFNGSTGAIIAGGNVSSITKHGTGDYSINFTTPMEDADYSVVGTTRANGVLMIDPVVAPTASAVRVNTKISSTLALTDYAIISVTVFR